MMVSSLTTNVSQGLPSYHFGHDCCVHYAPGLESYMHNNKAHFGNEGNGPGSCSFTAHSQELVVSEAVMNGLQLCLSHKHLLVLCISCIEPGIEPDQGFV
jgi:hypothetical protein